MLTNCARLASARRAPCFEGEAQMTTIARKAFAPSPLHDPAVRAAFVEALKSTRSLRRAAQRLGVCRETVARLRLRHPDFDDECRKFSRRYAKRIGEWRRKLFFAELAATADPAAAAKAIGVDASAMFALRDADPAFAAGWAAALGQAVERLEAKVVAAALAGKPGANSAAGGAVAVLRTLRPARRASAAAQSSLLLAMDTRERLLARIAELAAAKADRS